MDEVQDHPFRGLGLHSTAPHSFDVRDEFQVRDLARGVSYTPAFCVACRGFITKETLGQACPAKQNDNKRT